MAEDWGWWEEDECDYGGEKLHYGSRGDRAESFVWFLLWVSIKDWKWDERVENEEIFQNLGAGDRVEYLNHGSLRQVWTLDSIEEVALQSKLSAIPTWNGMAWITKKIDYEDLTVFSFHDQRQ